MVMLFLLTHSPYQIYDMSALCLQLVAMPPTDQNIIQVLGYGKLNWVIKPTLTMSRKRDANTITKGRVSEITVNMGRFSVSFSNALQLLNQVTKDRHEKPNRTCFPFLLSC